MEVNQIRYFLELKEHEHMSVTADLLGISQPTLSRSIASLEAELGMKLFDRVGKRIHLNNNGEEFAKYAEKSLRILEYGITSAKNVHYEVTGQITLLCYAYAPLIAACIASYSKLNPYVHFQISQFALGQNLKRAENPDFIFCSSSDSSFSQRQEQFWVPMALYSEKYMLAASPDFLPMPEEKTSINLQDLHETAFVTMTQRNLFFQDAAFPLCQNAGFFAKSPYQTDSYTMKMKLVENGLAAAIFSESVIRTEKEHFSKLRVYSLENCPNEHTLYLLRQKKATMTEAARDFWEYVLDYYEKTEDSMW